MEEYNIPFTCTSYRKIDEEGKPLNKIVRPVFEADYWYCLNYGNSIGNSTAMYKIGTDSKIYAPNIRKRNDFAMWLQVLKTKGHVVGIPEVLASYRVRCDSLSAKKMQLIKYQWQLYRNIEKLTLYNCLFALGCLFVRKCWDAVKKR